MAKKRKNWVNYVCTIMALLNFLKIKLKNNNKDYTKVNEYGV